MAQLSTLDQSAEYPGPDGIDRPAPMTFATKTEAARRLALIEAELVRDGWINPALGDPGYLLPPERLARAVVERMRWTHALYAARRPAQVNMADLSATGRAA